MEAGGLPGLRMTALACDVAQGGADETVIAHRYGAWFGERMVKPGVETPDPPSVPGLVATRRRDGASDYSRMGSRLTCRRDRFNNAVRFAGKPPGSTRRLAAPWYPRI